jgi:MFS family permease
VTPPTTEEDVKAAVGGEVTHPTTTAAAGLWHKFSKFRAVEALAYRDFRLLWLGHSFSSVAFWMDQVSRGWLIYELTDSTLQLGLVRGVQAIPTLFLSPVAGSTADRYSRKLQIMIAQVADGLMLAALAVLIFTGRVEPWNG